MKKLIIVLAMVLIAGTAQTEEKLSGEQMRKDVVSYTANKLAIYFVGAYIKGLKEQVPDFKGQEKIKRIWLITNLEKKQDEYTMCVSSRFKDKWDIMYPLAINNKGEEMFSMMKDSFVDCTSEVR